MREGEGGCILCQAREGSPERVAMPYIHCLCRYCVTLVPRSLLLPLRKRFSFVRGRGYIVSGRQGGHLWTKAS